MNNLVEGVELNRGRVRMSELLYSLLIPKLIELVTIAVTQIISFVTVH
jgi:hypothetical protein